MKVLVTVKEVAEVDDEFRISGLDVDDGSLEYDLNEWDDYAVEEAVQLSEADDDVEVVTVTIGPERAEETIRMALAKGADRAVRVWDDNLADAGFLDVDTKAALLAAVVNDFELDGDAGVASVRRELEGGVEELTDVELPAVFTIQTGINEPRYASLRGIRQAQRKELEVRTIDDVGLDESVVESPVERTDMYEPASEGDATYWEGNPEETAGELAAFLRDEGVVSS